MTIRIAPNEALDQYRNARTQWVTYHDDRNAVELEINTLLNANEKPSGYAHQLEMLRERLVVLKWQINCAARECVYSQYLLMESCTEDALSEFMEMNGTALASALAPFIKGRGGLDAASRMLRSALARQLAKTTPEISDSYGEILNECGLIPDPLISEDCQNTYTPAQHMRFQQRLKNLHSLQEGN